MRTQGWLTGLAGRRDPIPAKDQSVLRRTPSSRSGHIRNGGLVALIAAVLSIVGCRSSSGAAGAPLPGPGAAAPRPRTDVSVPPGINSDRLTPLAGEARVRALMPLDQVIAAIEASDYLGAPYPDGADPPGEPPLAAQRAFLAGRQAWRDRKNFDAISELQAANRLAPNQPEILRLLGRIFTTSGNWVRGAYFLREAVRIDPTHLESVFLLGRFALDQEQWSEAIVTLHEGLGLVDSLRGGDRVIERLARYALAVALMQDGYAAAAIEQYHAFLSGSTKVRRVSPFGRELLILERQRGVTWRAMGDLHHRLDDPASALEAYEKAAELGLNNQFDLVRRRVYTLLRLRRDIGAQQLVIHQISSSRPDVPTLALVRYLRDQGIAAEQLARRLKAVYDLSDHAPALALAVADLMRSEQAKAMLDDHIRANPADRIVFERLVGLWLAPPSPDIESHVGAIGVTARAMVAAPALAEYYARVLVRSVEDLSALSGAFDSIPASPQPDPVLLVLRGITLGQAGWLDEAEPLFEQAMEADTGLTIARVNLARVMVLTGRLDRAARILEPLSDSNDRSVIAMRVEVLSKTGRVTEALDLVNRMIDSGAVSTRLVLQKARLQQQLRWLAEAERTLMDALNANPDQERLYEALFQLYAPGELPDSDGQQVRLLRRLLDTIPNSRLGRLSRAELYEAKGQHEQAEKLLLGLIEENEQDVRALADLLNIHVRANRRGRAIDVLEGKLEARPNDRLLLVTALEFYKQIKDTQRGDAIKERLLLLEPPGPERALALGVLYVQTDRPARAVTEIEAALGGEPVDDPGPLLSVLAGALLALDREDEAEQRFKAAVEQFPQHQADLLYGLASFVATAGDRNRSEQLLVDLLAKFPDHPATNNDLGYSWAVQNKNLVQARIMIEKAVEAEPDNDAYLDSMGWILYKIGEFEDAAVWLRRATAVARRRAQLVSNAGTRAVLADHLGDALYRLGKQTEAARSWSRAAALLTGEQASRDSEIEDLGSRLSTKIEAVKAKRDVPVADVPSRPVPDQTESKAEAVSPSPPSGQIELPGH